MTSDIFIPYFHCKVSGGNYERINDDSESREI